MTKLKNVFLVFMILFFASITFTGCINKPAVQLATPINIYTQSSNAEILLVVTSDPNATSYEFSFYSGLEPDNYENYVVIESTSAFLDITNIVQDSKFYYFYVKAIGDGEQYLDSELSERFEVDNTGTLPSPQPVLTGTILNWTQINNSVGYDVYVNDVKLDLGANDLDDATKTSLDVASLISEMIVYKFEVVARGLAGSEIYKSSYKSVPVEYTEHLVLDVPTNLVITTDPEDGDVLFTWDEVTGAQSYAVMFNNEPESELHVADAFVSVLPYLLEGRMYNFKVKALAPPPLLDSEYSDNIAYENYMQLSTPTNVFAKRNGDDIQVTWEASEHANDYTLYINDVIYDNTIFGTGISVTNPDNWDDENGHFKLEVVANGYNYYTDSEKALMQYTGIDVLSAPENIFVNNTGAATEILWDAVDEASGYEIIVNNDAYSTLSTTYNVGQHFEADEIYSIKIRSLGQGYLSDSELKDVRIINNTALSVNGYTNNYYYHYGYHDHFITSQDELDNLLSYAFTYHVEGFDAYIYYDLTPQQEYDADQTQIYDPNGNPIYVGNQDMLLQDSEAINYKQYLALQAYTETHNITYLNPQPTGFTQYEYEFSFTFTGDLNPSLVSNDPNRKTQNADFAPYQSSTGRDLSYNDFAPEQAFIEVEVNNTNQLFAVINAGAKPVFATENTQAEQVYELAKGVLRTIIDDGMTDYEKMVAIYDWVSYNVIYDTVVYDIVINTDTTGWTEEQILELHTSIQNYNVFYLEGVFVDGVAVCDGIAKSVALLANMEGIEAIKVNGTAGDLTSTIGHAWNKVNIDVDGNGTKEWYLIDATWGDTNVGGEETLSKEYFMLTDLAVINTHFAESYNPTADTTHNYFDEMEYVSGYDYYITSQAELDHLMQYLVLNGVEGAEIMIDYNYSSLSNALQLATNDPALDALTNYNVYNGYKENVYIMDLIY